MEEEKIGRHGIVCYNKKIFPVSFGEITRMKREYLSNKFPQGRQSAFIPKRKDFQRIEGARMKPHYLSIDCNVIQPQKRNIIFTNWREPEKEIRSKSITPYSKRIIKNSVHLSLEPINFKDARLIVSPE